MYNNNNNNDNNDSLLVHQLAQLHRVRGRVGDLREGA